MSGTTPTRGRRRASRRDVSSTSGRHHRDRTTAAAALVLVLVGAGAAVLASAQGHHRAGAAGVGADTVTVTSATRVCPPRPGPAPGHSRTLVTSVPLPDSGSSGEVRSDPLGGESAGGRLPLSRGEQLRLPALPRHGTGLVVQAKGQLATGLEAHRLESGSGGGPLAAGRCAAPGASWWFTGAGGTLLHRSRLVVSNVDQGPAVVDVSVLARGGPVDAVGTRGITVAPGDRKVVDLTDLAPGRDELAVHVATTQGRVVAGLLDSFRHTAGGPAGVEWVPAQPTGRRTVRLAGLPGHAGGRTLVLANPGPTEALVHVTVAGESGSFAPAGTAQVRIPPGAVVSKDVTDALGHGALAVRLTSPTPVVATVRSQIRDDTSYAAAVVPVQPGSAVPLPDASTLLLSAGEGAATARVTTYTRAGHQAETSQVEVPGHGTTSWSPHRPAAYVVVSPRSGSVFGAVSVHGKGALTELPLRSLQVRMRRPAVRPQVP